ncbi:MAG: sulfite exporter TauE/SafE family protein [Candidatus Omnitrophota bacterium]
MPITISFFILGLSFGSGPCMASCGPLLLTYIAGTAKSVSKGLLSYILFSCARISVYLAAGVSVYFLGRIFTGEFLGALSRYVFVLGGAFIISVGVLLILGKDKQAGFCKALQKKLLQNDKKSIIILGLIIGLAPCAPLLAIFSYLGLISKNWALALTYSFFFGLGTLISPLLVLAALTGAIPRILADKSAYRRIFNFFCGGILVFLGLQLIWRTF